MTECIFCKIIVGEVPCNRLYEDNEVFAFLDISPVNKGHTLVVPKRHCENVYALDDETAKALGKAIRDVAVAVKKGVGAAGINVHMNNDKAAGQLVPHAHYHIIPRFEGDGLTHWPGGTYKEGEAEKIQEQITAQL